MKHNLLVSIGIPTYNHAGYIKKTLASLEKQTYKHIEIIISNNASTDDTHAICEAFARRHPRVRYFRQKKNIGAANNFNFVFSKAKGKYFMWLASDDVINRNYIKELVSGLMAYPKAILAVTNLTYFTDDKKIRYKLAFRPYEQSIDALKIFLLNPKYIATMFYGMYRTKSLKKIFYRNGLLTNPFHFSYTEDIRFLFRVLLHGGLVHSDTFYFSKRNTTYVSAMKDNLSEHHLSKRTAWIITQNILLLLSVICNFFYFQYYIYTSDKKILHKFILTYYAAVSVCIDIIDFIKNTLTCILWFVKGLMKTLRQSGRRQVG